MSLPDPSPQGHAEERPLCAPPLSSDQRQAEAGSRPRQQAPLSARNVRRCWPEAPNDQSEDGTRSNRHQHIDHLRLRGGSRGWRSRWPPLRLLHGRRSRLPRGRRRRDASLLRARAADGECG